MQTPIGCTGRVVQKITPDERGEVMIAISGGGDAYYAESQETLEKGQQVVVTDYLPPRTVYVKAKVE